MDDLAVALEAARAGAARLRDLLGHVDVTHWKSSEVDPVTAADLAAESAVLEVIGRARPQDAVLSEEAERHELAAGRQWVIDPLDGTVNFLHAVPHVGVSVALVEEGSPVAGVVIDVMREHEYVASVGGGAFRDGERLAVSGAALGSALIATGFPYDRRDKPQMYADRLAKVMAEVQGIRRLGAATLDLAWVAAGILDGYWEASLGPWDMAAGVLLVQEAGGVVTDAHGQNNRLDHGSVIAAGPTVHSGLLQILQPEFAED